MGLLSAALALATAAATALMAAPASASTQVVTIAPTTMGTSLKDSSLGLSFEASDLALPGFTAGNLASYLKTPGTSVMRIGGNTVDETFWTSAGETPPSWSIATITPADLTALDTLAAPTQTPVSVDGDRVTVSIPAGTAELLTFSDPPGGGTSATFTGALSGKCLSVLGASTADGAAADIYTCNGRGSETWN